MEVSDIRRWRVREGDRKCVWISSWVRLLPSLLVLSTIYYSTCSGGYIDMGIWVGFLGILKRV